MCSYKLYSSVISARESKVSLPCDLSGVRVNVCITPFKYVAKNLLKKRHGKK